MVRAILAGKKTQTRRIVSSALVALEPEMWQPKRPGIWETYDHLDPGMVEVGSPYGVPGDFLWVRETWAPSVVPGRAPLYRADLADIKTGWRWHPSIHMPRAASRIDLEVVSVSVERLHSLDEADAFAEGVSGSGYVGQTPHRDHFAAIWDAINGKRGSWESNPWVWVVNFNRKETA